MIVKTAALNHLNNRPFWISKLVENYQFILNSITIQIEIATH
jgi:hypothetical protein